MKSILKVMEVDRRAVGDLRINKTLVVDATRLGRMHGATLPRVDTSTPRRVDVSTSTGKNKWTQTLDDASTPQFPYQSGIKVNNINGLNDRLRTKNN